MACEAISDHAAKEALDVLNRAFCKSVGLWVYRNGGRVLNSCDLNELVEQKRVIFRAVVRVEGLEEAVCADEKNEKKCGQRGGPLLRARVFSYS